MAWPLHTGHTFPVGPSRVQTDPSGQAGQGRQTVSGVMVALLQFSVCTGKRGSKTARNWRTRGMVKVLIHGAGTSLLC